MLVADDCFSYGDKWRRKKKRKKQKETYNLLLSYRLHVDRDVKGFGFGEDRANLKNK